MQTVELGSEMRSKRVQSGHGICGDIQSRCGPSSLRSFSMVLALTLFGALVAFVSAGGWGINGVRKLSDRQSCQPCEETWATTSNESKSKISSAQTLPLEYESISEIYSTYNQTPGLDH